MQDSVKRYAEDARHAHGVNVRIRVGLNSGDVVVRAIGSDLRMDYTAVGQTTHLAARMEQLALPGTIVMTPATLDLVEGLVAVSSLGPMPVKGLPEPLEVFEVTGVGVARTRLHAAARRGLTRFVGRDGELEQLWRAQELAGKGRGQVVAVVGEAGVGKSRLVYEFTHSHRLQGWLVLEGASVSYGKATGYLPVIALLRSYFKIQDRDDQREIRERVTGKILALDRALEPTLPALLSLLDVLVDDPDWQTMAPEQRRRQTLDGVKRLLLREARERPLVVIFEDLHWIDSQTQALLDDLVESLGSARLLLLVNYRPEYRHAWTGKTYYSQLRLDPLLPASASDLLDALLGNDPSLAPLKQLLVKRGNPFFVEESVRTLVETKALSGERGQYQLTQPVGTIQMPATVQAMLAARIDRLPPDEKRLLQVASVVGKDVPLTLLQAVVEHSDDLLRHGLGHLTVAEFLRESGLYPELMYSFTHALTHEVTYGGLLQESRRELHRRVVVAIETVFADRLNEHVDRLAYHAHRGALGEKAVDYLHQAGMKAASRSALGDAQAFLEQALEILDGLPESQATLERAFELRLELRPVVGLLGGGRRVLEMLRQAEKIAERLNDLDRLGRVSAFIANALTLVGELDEALEAGIRALNIAERQSNLRLRILGTGFLAWIHRDLGDLERAVAMSKESLALLPLDWRHEFLGRTAPTYVYDLHHLVFSLTILGRFSEAAEYALEATRVADSLGNPTAITMVSHAAGNLHSAKGEWKEARRCYERAVNVSQSGGILSALPVWLAGLANSLARLGEVREASERVRDGERSLDLLAANANVVLHAGTYNGLGRACLQLGWTDEALRLGQRAVECSPKQPPLAAVALHLLGDVISKCDPFDAERAEELYRNALSLAEPRAMRPLVAHCHGSLASLFGRMRKRQAARDHLSTATTLYREMGMQFWLEQAEMQMRVLR